MDPYKIDYENSASFKWKIFAMLLFREFDYRV